LTENSGDTREAITRAQQILAANPMDMVWRKRLSSLFLNQNEKEKSIQLWRDWFSLDQTNDFQRLSAIEEIQQLGDTEQALDLFHQLEDKIPIPLKQFEARSALELGLFDQAISSFHIASISANVNPAGITNMIITYADTQSDHVPMMSAFINAASGNAFQETPGWLRDALVECGVKYGMDDQLRDMAAQDPSGVWAIHIANAAKKYGKKKLVQTLLETVPKDSILRDSADEQFVDLVSSNPSVLNQNEAAELILPSIQEVLSSTEPQNLTLPQVQQLMQYSQYRLNAYQPGLALKAVQTIEASTPFLMNGLIETDMDRIKFYRAKALSQLASFDPAMTLLETIENPPYKSQANFLRAKIFLAQKKLEEADTLLLELIIDRSDWQLSNDALGYVIAMEPLFGEPMSDFCKLQTFLLQGRMEEAFPILRSLAVDYYETDTEEWARYQIADLQAQSGQWEDAVVEWKRLLLDVDHPVYHGLVRYKLTNVPSQANHLVESASQFQELLTEFPNSLFSDLARIEAEERLKGLYP
jgi:tetratricopeptide (TPR) repeat protein